VIQQISPGVTVVRSADMPDGIVLMVMAGALAEKTGGKSVVSQKPNVYPDIALILTSEAVERKAFQEAIGYADRGLALQPENWGLLFEKGAALQGLRRWQDGLTLADKALAGEYLLLTMHQAPFHRRRGFSLVELGRLEEARAAYEEALKIEPDNAVAKQELEYVSGLMKGAKPTAPYLVNPNKPAGN
jgi:tetratricopeptide (TPR) repeat protein